ncbi:MAG: DNA alkylation repair protein [Planctomycetota bacterium]
MATRILSSSRCGSEVPAATVIELNAAKAEAANLAESLAVDFASLLQASLPALPSGAIKAMHAARADGYLRRMTLAAELALEHTGPGVIETLKGVPSDTARGWACYAIGITAPNADDAIQRIRPLAADPHYGVREWAWLGVRPHVVAEPIRAIELLTPWVHDPDPNVRRFATEATRPRGVWCTHITQLKDNPAPGLPLLEPMRADAAKYVQDSVANWLNDASKTAPDWVTSLTTRWTQASDNPCTARIARRALRTLTKQRRQR